MRASAISCSARQGRQMTSCVVPDVCDYIKTIRQFVKAHEREDRDAHTARGRACCDKTFRDPRLAHTKREDPRTSQQPCMGQILGL